MIFFLSPSELHELENAEPRTLKQQTHIASVNLEDSGVAISLLALPLEMQSAPNGTRYRRILATVDIDNPDICADHFSVGDHIGDWMLIAGQPFVVDSVTKTASGARVTANLLIEAHS